MPWSVFLFLSLGTLLALLTAASIVRRLAAYDTAGRPRDERIATLDGLRGYLALFVLVHHYAIWAQMSLTGWSWRPLTSFIFNQFGSGAVAIFFMVTGTLFYPRVVAGWRATSWRILLVERSFRILPPVTATLVLVVALLMIETGRTPTASDFVPMLEWVSAWDQPPLLGYQDASIINAQVLWTLRWEWLFYLAILPLSAIARDLCRLVGLPSAAVPLLLLLIATVASLTLQAPPGPTWWSVLAFFAFGMLAREASDRPGCRKLFGSKFIRVPASILFVVALLSSPQPFGLTLPLFPLLYISVVCGNDFRGLLRSHVARKLGDLSFGVYLLHGIILWVGFEALGLQGSFSPPHILLTLPLFAASTVVAGALFHRWIEVPSIRAGRKTMKLLLARSSSAGERVGNDVALSRS